MQKSFWQRPEGITGALFLAGLLVGAGMLWNQILPFLIAAANNTLYLAGMLMALAAVIYVALDAKTRNLVWYMYKSVMRWITGIFVRIDPISILKSYLEDLRANLLKLSRQIGSLRGQMRQLKGLMDGNNAEIQKNMTIAEQAKKKSDEKNLTLAARKAARLQDANAKYDVLYKRMDVLNRILTKMYENSEFVLEDTQDQIQVKEQEYLAIKTGHSAIQSAMSILSGDPDKKELFEMAMEELADDVGNKVGEMERFMDTSRNLMDSIDLQNGVFADDGLQMLEQWEKESPLLANNLKGHKSAASAEKPLDLNKPPQALPRDDNDYTRLFE
jgi:phage shock protein A